MIKIWLTRIANSKTLIFSVVLSVLGAVQASMDVFTAYLTPKGMGLLTLAVGVIVAILRVLTTQDIRDK
jgi:hypothetical protein